MVSKLLENMPVVRSVVNDLLEEGSCGDRVSSLTISEETDWTVGSGLVKGLTEAGSCGDGLSSVRTSDKTEGTEASSLTEASRTRWSQNRGIENGWTRIA